jgi:hypothetical protein
VMRKTAISLGLALALGVLQNYSLGQTPAQKLDTTSQTPSISAVAGNPTKAQSDKSTQNQARKWHIKLGPVLVGASYNRFGGPFYYPYGLSPFDGFYRAWLWDPYWAYLVSYPSGYFGYDGERGEIKLTLKPRTVDPKLAEVCVNNGFAGTAGQLNNMCSNQELTNCRF